MIWIEELDQIIKCIYWKQVCDVASLSTLKQQEGIHQFYTVIIYTFFFLLKVNFMLLSVNIVIRLRSWLPQFTKIDKKIMVFFVGFMHSNHVVIEATRRLKGHACSTYMYAYHCAVICVSATFDFDPCILYVHITHIKWLSIDLKISERITKIQYLHYLFVWKINIFSYLL